MIYRRFEENDLQSLLRLLRSVFNGHPKMQHWIWKYTKNPHGSPLIWVAEDDGKIVGCYILNPVKLRVRNVSVMGAQAVDAAVDSSYRGGGIFKKLAVDAIAQAAKDGVSIIYAFPNEISYRGQLRIGYLPVSVIPRMYKIFRAGSLLEGRVGFSGSSLQNALGMMDTFQRIKKEKIGIESNHELKVSVISDFDSRFETFWKEVCKENNSVLVERDLAYLNWRYIEHPEKDYTVYACQKDNEVVGYAVVNVERNAPIERASGPIEAERTHRLSLGNIIDLLTLPNVTKAAYRLVSASCDYFERESVDIAQCWMFRWHPFHPILSKFGFSDLYGLLRRSAFPSKYVSRLICYVNSEAAIQEAIRSMPSQGKPCWWFVTQGDADYT